MTTKEKTIDDLIYESGIIAQGCFDKYDVDALKEFAMLVRKDYSFTHAQMWLKRFDDAIKTERQRIINLLMMQHEAAKGAHNYWHVAAQLIQTDVASDT